MKFKNGFTLVEMLIVISILSVMGVLILNIFSRTLKGSNKSQIIANIKQNGQAVLENMDKTIRNSDNIVCPAFIPPATSASSNSLIIVKNGIYTRYRFINPQPTGDYNRDCMPPTSFYRNIRNGCIVQDNPLKQLVSGREETDAQFINRVCLPANPLSSWNVLTDTQYKTGVSVENGLFVRERSAGFSDQVTIKFDLKPGLGAPQAVAGTIDPVTFQTTIQLR